MVSTKDLKKLEIAANQKIKERDYWLNKLSGERVKSIFPYDRAKTKTKNGKPPKPTISLAVSLHSRPFSINTDETQL